MKHHIILRRIPLGMILAVAASITLLLASVQAIAKGYRTQDEELSLGMVVSLVTTPGSEEAQVERATPDTVDRVVGITVDPSGAVAAIGSSGSQVFVQTSNEADGYVTDLNGSVQRGDRLTVSPLRGLLMKADDSDKSVALAMEDAGDVTAETEVTLEDGSTRQVKMMRIAVNVSAQSGTVTKDDDSALARLGQSIVNKDVSELQVIIALVIFLLMVVVEGAIIYAAVSSGITSLGRNPLAKDLIRKELIRIVGVALFVLLIGLAAIYAILWV